MTGQSQKVVKNGNGNKRISSDKKDFKPKLVWTNIIAFIYLHIAFLYSIYLIITVHPMKTFWFAFISGASATAYGIAAGAHRLWAHNAFRAKWPLKVILMICQTIAGQNCIFIWARDHRVHHKFSDTDADPHSISRGFFFAHIGWLMMEKHPEVKRRGATVDVSDLERDWVVMFQKKYYYVLYMLLAIIVPTWIPMYFWGETLNNSWHIATIFRYVLTLHITWCLNSVAHTFGNKPYDKNIQSTEATIMGALGIGEGWHNFHHTFPWDYRCSELGHKELSYINRFIDFFASIGWAYDLKTVSQDMIKKRVMRTGDGTHQYSQKSEQNNNIDNNNFEVDDRVFWGWDDKDMTDSDKKAADIRKKVE